MEEDTLTAKSCKCTISSQCEIEDCQCKDFCVNYVELYNKILDGGQYCYMTISPKPSELQDDDDKLAMWLSDFRNLLSCSDKFIIVAEYTQKAILHFHIMIKIKDRVKWIKRFVQRWYHISNICPIYKNQPKYGIHYLFKEIYNTQEVLQTLPIWTSDTIKELKTKRDLL